MNQDKQPTQINLQDLGIQELDQLATTLSLEIAKMELNKANLVSSLAATLHQLHQLQSQQVAPTQEAIRLPKLKPINTPNNPPSSQYQLNKSM